MGEDWRAEMKRTRHIEKLKQKENNPYLPSTPQR